MSNGLALIAYTSGTTPAQNTELDRAQDVSFTTLYPGGRYGDLSFFLARDVTRAWTVKENQRITATNGMTLVWEGIVTAITTATRAGEEGFQVTAYGYWGAILMERTTHKPWADRRIDANVWVDTNNAERAMVERQDGYIKLIPKQVRDAAGDVVNWTVGNAVSVRYIAPTYETIKRVTFTSVLQEASQNWSFHIYNYATAGYDWSVTSTGTAAVDVTLGAASGTILLYLNCAATQNPPNDNTVYAQASNVCVYTETGPITAQAIAEDVVYWAGTLYTEMSADTSKIGALTYDLSTGGFIAEPRQSWADVLTMAASYGDASNNAWACYVGPSSWFSDGKPGLVLEQQPALTDYDIYIDMTESNVGDGVSFSKDLSEVKNYITVTYANEEGIPQEISVSDTTSITAYGRRDLTLNIATTSATTAAQYAKTVLAARKNLQWKANGEIPVIGWARRKGVGKIAACEIHAGQRLRVMNYLNDLSGTGLTFLVTATRYDDATQTVYLTVGRSDASEVWLARKLYELQNGGR